MAVRACLSHLPDNVHLISHVHPKGAHISRAATAADQGPQRSAPRKKGERLPGHGPHGRTIPKNRGPNSRSISSACTPNSPQRQDATGPLLQSGRLAFVDDRPDARSPKAAGQDQMSSSHRTFAWDVRQILSKPMPVVGPSSTHFRKRLQTIARPGRPGQSLARLWPLPAPRPMALFLYSILITWFHRVGHAWVQFPRTTVVSKQT